MQYLSGRSLYADEAEIDSGGWNCSNKSVISGGVTGGRGEPVGSDGSGKEGAAECGGLGPKALCGLDEIIRFVLKIHLAFYC